VTASARPAPKSINYKLHPDNLPVVGAAGIDCCTLANNHVLDWGEAGLVDTLAALDAAGIAHAGAGRDAAEAARPAIVTLDGGGRVIVLSLAHGSSGVPDEWAAGPGHPGVALLADLGEASIRQIASRVAPVKRAGDIVVASVHWGGNWGYAVTAAERAFAHGLIEAAGVDVVHGHSCHHPKPIEVHRGKLILYGCGDFINDYEGIQGYEAYRGDLMAMYLPRLEAASGRLVALELAVFRMARFRLNRASRDEAAWLASTLSRQGAPFGVTLQVREDATLRARWPGAADQLP
jgi:poly-gamma-glutamate capsule biosynthesis protein CapA/YwtB (metallophosphatase superfamily)